MRVGEIRTLAGPNVYSFRPVLSMKLYLDDLTGKRVAKFQDSMNFYLKHCLDSRNIIVAWSAMEAS